MTLLLRPRNFFMQNPALDVPPSHLMTTSKVLSGGAPTTIKSLTDSVSRLAFGETKAECCSK